MILLPKKSKEITMKIGQQPAKSRATVKNNASNEEKESVMQPGEVVMVLENIEEKQTKAGNGTLLDCMFRVTEGPYTGRVVYHNFFLDHPNAKCVQISIEILDKFLKSVGLSKGLDSIDRDTTRLTSVINKPFIAVLDIEAGKDGYRDRNKIKKFVHI